MGSGTSGAEIRRCAEQGKLIYVGERVRRETQTILVVLRDVRMECRCDWMLASWQTAGLVSAAKQPAGGGMFPLEKLVPVVVSMRALYHAI